MNIHQHARLSAAGRQAVVARVSAGEPVAAVARAVGVSRQTVYKWCRRLAADPSDAPDRSSRPHRSPTRAPRRVRRQMEWRRRQRWSSGRIAQYYGWPISSVVTHLRRVGLNRLSRLEPPRPVVRYERARPGELVHLDIKKLGRIGRVGHRIHGDRTRRTRGAGWEYLHVAIDDHSRVLYAEVLPDERGETTAGFLVRATAWYAQQGVMIERLLTDNGGAYRSLVFATTALSLGISQRFTRPYRPQTNGKAERVIRTLLAEWAYARAFGRSHWRTRALTRYLHFYNTARRHSALGYATPTSRLSPRL
jgi:transposase InsO family protein